MFKQLSAGRRSARGGGQTSRIRSPFNKFKGAAPNPLLPPFQTMDIREHAMDSATPRADENATGGYTGRNIGA